MRFNNLNGNIYINFYISEFNTIYFNLANQEISAVSNSPSKNKIIQSNPSAAEKSKDINCQDLNQCGTIKCSSDSRMEKRRDREKTKTQEKNKRNISKTATVEARPGGEILIAEKHSPKASDSTTVINTSVVSTCNRVNKKRNQKQDVAVNCTNIVTSAPVSSIKSITSTITPITANISTVDTKSQNMVHNKHFKSKEILMNGISGNSIPDYDELVALFGQNANIRGKKSSIEKLNL